MKEKLAWHQTNENQTLWTFANIIQLSWDFWCWKTDFLLSIAAKCSLTIKVDFHSSVYSWLFTVWFNAMKYIFWTCSEVELKIKDWSHCMKQSIIVRPEMHCVGNCVVIRYCYKAICNGEMELFREKCLLSKSILLLLFNMWTIYSITFESMASYS